MSYQPSKSHKMVKLNLATFTLVSLFPLSILTVSLISISLLTGCQSISTMRTSVADNNTDNNANNNAHNKPDIISNTPNDKETKETDDIDSSDMPQIGQDLSDYDDWDFKGVGNFNIRVSKNGKYGFFKNGELFTPLEYEEALDYKNDVATVKKNGKWGYLDYYGKIEIPFQFEEAHSFSDDMAQVVKGGERFYIDKKSKRLFTMPEGYAEDYGFSEGLASIRNVEGNVESNVESKPESTNGKAINQTNKKVKYGVMDNEGNIILEPTYEQLEYFHEGVAIVGNRNIDDNGQGKFGVIDRTGKLIVPLIYDEIKYSNEAIMVVQQKGKYGYIDQTGKVLITPKYDFAWEFDDSLGTILDGYDRYLIDEKGNLYRYWESEWDYGGMIRVYEDEKYGYLNQNRELVIPVEYDFAHGFENGFALVQKGDRFGIIDKMGKVVIPITYSDMTEVSDNTVFAKDKDNDFQGFINTEGELMFSTDRNLSYSKFLDGKSVIYNSDGKMVDKQGKTISADFIIITDYQTILPKTLSEKIKNNLSQLDEPYFNPNYYTTKGNVSDGMFSVTNMNKNSKDYEKIGYFDKYGKLIIPLQYDKGHDFFDGVAMVKKDSKWGLINKQGQMIIDFIYEDAREFSDGLAGVKLEGKWGFVNTSGKLVIPNKYNRVETHYPSFTFSDGKALVWLGHKRIVLDTQGNELPW